MVNNMKAKDLRIGNYVNMDGYPAEVFKITKAFIGCGRFRQKNFDEIEPIPLTEEWLIKFGFNKEHNEEWECNIPVFYLWYNESFKCFQISPNSNFPTTLLIKYVHQLQNLYFALTGEDLYLL